MLAVLLDPKSLLLTMRNLCLAAGSLGRYVQRKLSEENLWDGQFGHIKESLRSGITICERWVVSCETLTGQFWKRTWKGEKCSPEGLKKLATRLEEVWTGKLDNRRTDKDGI